MIISRVDLAEVNTITCRNLKSFDIMKSRVRREREEEGGGGGLNDNQLNKIKIPAKHLAGVKRIKPL